MKYCSHCGAQIDDEAVFCVKCGCPVAPTKTAPDDAPNAGFAVLGFFFPLIGLILYLVWKDTTPLRAKSVGKGALIGAIAEVAISILSVMFSFIFMTTAVGCLGRALCHILL